jgi:hypothetical protein
MFDIELNDHPCRRTYGKPPKRQKKLAFNPLAMLLQFLERLQAARGEHQGNLAEQADDQP